MTTVFCLSKAIFWQGKHGFRKLERAKIAEDTFFLVKIICQVAANGIVMPKKVEGELLLFNLQSSFSCCYDQSLCFV